MNSVKYFVTTLISFLALDSVWLGLVAPKFYKKYIGFVMADKPNFLAAGLFYLVFVFGLVYFVIQPSINYSSMYTVFIKGAIFGLVAYATFDLTNQAVVKNWPWLVTGVDLLWGSFITGTVSVIAVLLINKFFIN